MCNADWSRLHAVTTVWPNLHTSSSAITAAAHSTGAAAQSLNPNLQNPPVPVQWRAPCHTPKSRSVSHTQCKPSHGAQHSGAALQQSSPPVPVRSPAPCHTPGPSACRTNSAEPKAVAKQLPTCASAVASAMSHSRSLSVSRLLARMPRAPSAAPSSLSWITRS